MVAPNLYVIDKECKLPAVQIALLAEGMLPEIERCAVRVIKIGEVRAEPYC